MTWEAEQGPWKAFRLSAGAKELVDKCHELENRDYEIKAIVPHRLPEGGVTPGTGPEPGLGIYIILVRESTQN